MEIQLTDLPENYMGWLIIINPETFDTSYFNTEFSLHPYDAEEIGRLIMHEDFLSGAKVIRAEDDVIEIIIKKHD